MLSLSPATRIFVAVPAMDMRQGFNGLYAWVQTVLGEEPTSGHWFVFLNKRRNRLKILTYDGSGLWVLNKRKRQEGCAVAGEPTPGPLGRQRLGSTSLIWWFFMAGKRASTSVRYSCGLMPRRRQL